MKIKILCQTKKRESYAESGLKFNKEYAIGFDMSESDKDFIKNYGMRDVIGLYNPIITMSRRVDYREESAEPWDWDYYDVCKDIESAVMSFGDSDYWEAESLTVEHFLAVEKVKEIESIKKSIKKLEGELENLKSDFEGRYIEELKQRRLYTKVKNNTADPEIIAEIKTRLREEYNQESESLKNQIKNYREKIAINP